MLLSAPPVINKESYQHYHKIKGNKVYAEIEANSSDSSFMTIKARFDLKSIHIPDD